MFYLISAPSKFSLQMSPSPAVLEVEGEGGLMVSPPWVTARPVPSPTSKLKKLRLKAKDYRKGGDGLRGKNVTEAYRVKEKDLKRTMKWQGGGSNELFLFFEIQFRGKKFYQTLTVVHGQKDSWPESRKVSSSERWKRSWNTDRYLKVTVELVV